VGESSYRTEFANPVWWWAGFLLVVPVYMVSRRHPRAAVVCVIVALAPQFALPTIVIDRYADTGWGDGLEGSGYVAPVLMTLLFAVAAAFGYSAGRPGTQLHHDI
jgi:hypothetical protein